MQNGTIFARLNSTKIIRSKFLKQKRLEAGKAFQFSSLLLSTREKKSERF